MVDFDALRDPALRAIAEKSASGIAISDNDCRAMLTTDDILGLGAIADSLRRTMHGDRAYYGATINLNYTNVCELRCPICAFSCDRGDADAFTLDLETVQERVARALRQGIGEVHIVGGLNPELPLDYYTGLLRAIKAVDADIFIVAFTAVEYDFFSRTSGVPLEEIFPRFRAAGLGAIPGGGAEIFAPRARNIITPKKIGGDRWLEVMRAAHAAGIQSNATMLYNHVERVDDIVDHLARIRNLQGETGGFKTFVPLPYHDANTAVRSLRPFDTGFDDIRIFASARIFLHTVPHLKALWMYLGEKMAQVLLNFGVDDFGATYNDERVVHAAGAKTPDYGSEEFLIRLIRNAGRVPVRTTAGYGGA